MMCSMKRAARHSIDAEVCVHINYPVMCTPTVISKVLASITIAILLLFAVSQVPNQAISTLYPPDDNYELHPTDSTRRCPKSLTELCIDTLCRSLPNLHDDLPAGLPKEIVDRILHSLTSHAALNSTTLRALRKCDLNKLSLANCRGVSDEWLLSFGSSSGSNCSDSSNSSSGSGSGGGGSETYISGPKLPSLGDAYPAQWPNPSNTGIEGYPTETRNGTTYDDLNNAAHQYHTEGSNADDNMEVLGADDSYESCSTSSFVSASSHPHSPFLYPIRCAPSGLSSSLWMRGSSQANDGGMNSNEFPSTDNIMSGDDHDESSYDYSSADSRAADAGGGTASMLTLLDLRGSQRLTDRGLIQLSHTPLRTLEVALLDNCHGITGRGLIAFAKSHRLRTLSMSNCRRLTDEAVVNVSHLGPSLVALNLGGCRCLTDRSLEALRGMVELRRLDLSQVSYDPM